jgi:hypothetical protein
MVRLAWIVGLLVLLGGGAALAWVLAPRLPAKPDIPKLQALATESCRCARAQRGNGAKRSCWVKFEGQAAHYKAGEFRSYCEPLSPSGYSFGDRPESQVVTEYSGMPEVSLCSLDEARIAQAAYDDALERRRAGDGSASPEGAFLAASEALARGEKLAASSSNDGCAG